MSIQIISRHMKVINFGNILVKHCALIPTCSCQQSFYSSKPSNILGVDDPISAPQERRKTKIIPKITLINDEQLTVTTLEEAQRLSKRRDLKLVKIVDLDTKTQRPIYKLMTGPEYFAEDIKQRELKKKEKQANITKGDKLLILGNSISEHDLNTNIRKISKWITKSYEVRVVISGASANTEKADKIYNLLEDSLKSVGKFVQKRQKGSDVKFQIIPPKKEKDDDNKSL